MKKGSPVVESDRKLGFILVSLSQFSESVLNFVENCWKNFPSGLDRGIV
jgi:hypothetical protein